MPTFSDIALCSCIYTPTRYKTRAYRFLNAEAVAKKERREAERRRVQAEKAAAAAKIEADRAALAEEDEKEQKKVGAPSNCLYITLSPYPYCFPDDSRHFHPECRHLTIVLAGLDRRKN
jgi:hypothetical protein